MRISGTPLSFLNLGSRRPTPIEAVVIGGDLDSPLPILRVGLVSMNMLSSLSVVARKPPGEEGTRLGGLKTSLHPNLLDPPQPAEAPGAFEERGRQALARLMASAAMNGAGGRRYRSRVPYNQRLLRLPLPMDNGAATSEARSPAPGSGAICAIGTDGHRGTNWFTDNVAGSGFDSQGSDPASPAFPVARPFA